MSRTEKFFKNTISAAVLQFVTIISAFIIPKIMLTVYGSETNGLITSITMLISYLILVEAGLSGAIVYSLYKPLAESNINKINSIISAGRIFYNKTGYLFLSLLIGMAFIYPFLIDSTTLTKFDMFFLVLILGFSGVLEFFTLAKYRAILTADQKTYIISMASIIQVIFNVFFIYVLSTNGFSIVLVKFFSIVAIIIRTVLLWLYCKINYSFLDFKVKGDFSALSKRWDALYLQIIGVIHIGAPVIIATVILSLNEVSIYSIYLLIVSGVNSLLNIFTSGLSASFGDLMARNEKENFRKVFTEFEYLFYIILTIVFSITMITYIPFIGIYTHGADISYVYPTLAFLMTINGYLYNLKTPYGMLTISAGKYRESRVQITIQGLIGIIVGVLLAFKWGLNGIVIGAIASNLYRNIDFIFFAPKHLTHYSFKSSLIMWVRSILIVIIFSILGFIISKDYISTYLELVKFAIIIGIFSTLVTLIINIISDYALFKSVLKRMTALVVKK